MKRCKVCGMNNEIDVLYCKTCNAILIDEPFYSDANSEKIRIDSILGLLFIIYGLVLSIINLIIIKEIPFEYILFIFFGIYMNKTNSDINLGKRNLENQAME